MLEKLLLSEYFWSGKGTSSSLQHSETEEFLTILKGKYTQTNKHWDIECVIEILWSKSSEKKRVKSNGRSQWTLVTQSRSS